MKTPMKSLALALALALALPALPALAGTNPASAGTSIITVPPRSMQSMQVQETPGADSTLWSYGVPGPQNSSVTIPLPGGSGSGGPPPSPLCTPNSTTQSSGAACPTGQTVGGVTGGATVFTQTRQINVTCPGGPSVPGTTTYGPWAPSVATTCATPSAGGGSTCTAAQVQSGQCTTCSRVCGSFIGNSCRAGIPKSHFYYTGAGCPTSLATYNFVFCGACP